jgi:hypothetical protein
MRKFSKKTYRTYIIAGILILLGILFRTLWHMGDNVEFVTSASFLAAAYLGLGWSVVVPFLIMMISDIYIGTTSIFLFTWSAYIVIAFVAYKAMKNRKQTTHNKRHLVHINQLLHVTGLGVGASVWFYLWTNFGVWILDSWGMYPRTLTGLMDAYIMGLPFFKSNIVGNAVLVPSAFVVAWMTEKIGAHFFRWVKQARKAYV